MSTIRINSDIDNFEALSSFKNFTLDSNTDMNLDNVDDICGTIIEDIGDVIYNLKKIRDCYNGYQYHRIDCINNLIKKYNYLLDLLIDSRKKTNTKLRKSASKIVSHNDKAVDKAQDIAENVSKITF